MSVATLTRASVEALTQFDTASVCNALEVLRPGVSKLRFHQVASHRRAAGSKAGGWSGQGRPHKSRRTVARPRPRPDQLV